MADQETITKKRKLDDATVDNTTNNDDNVNNNQQNVQHTEESTEDRTNRVKLMLSTMKKDDLVELLTKSALVHNDLFSSIEAKANQDPGSRKLFIRGLAYSTTIETVKQYFSQYGEIEEGTVVKHRDTGQSKGYGFLTFTDIAAAHRALKEPKKHIENRDVFCNLAAAGDSSRGGHSGGDHSGGGGGHHQSGGNSQDSIYRKLFVRGLSWDTSDDSFLHLFSQYGMIEEGGIVKDKNTGKSKGFGFVTYKTIEAAREALKQPEKHLDGRNIYANLAIDGKRSKDQPQQGGNAAASGGNTWQQSAGGYTQGQPPAPQWGNQGGAWPNNQGYRGYNQPGVANPYQAYGGQAYGGYAQPGYSGYTGAQPPAAPGVQPLEAPKPPTAYPPQ